MAETSEPSPPAAARRGVIILTAAAFLFSVMALCAKEASARLPGPEVACMRFLIGLLSAVIPLLSGRGLHPVNYLPLFLRGLFGGGAVMLYFLAIAHLPVGIATLLNSSWPVFVVPFSFLFLGEPLRVRAIFALLVTSVGVVLVVLGGTKGPGPEAAAVTLSLGTQSPWWGLCGLGSALFSAAAVTTVRSMRKSEGSWEIFLAFCLIGSAVTAVPSAFDWVCPTRMELFWLFLMGISAAAAQMAMTYALRDVKAITTGIILQLTPIATLVFGALLFVERPTPLGWVGTFLTLCGVTYATVTRNS